MGRVLAELAVRRRQQWRKWLQAHHDSESEIWLVFNKRHTARESISYDDAVEEALCFGWIDSIVRRLDDDRYARKFTPRTRARSAFVSPYHIAYVYTGLGESDRAMDWLERAVAERTGPAYSIKGSFLLTSLHTHPRFRALLRKMKLE
ncbi:MAG: hypothetical protein M3P26_09065 [Gemmatimonadota bacterium]|nr:hypothetical protein [Gemmatimonadota bacterium]